MLEKIGLDLVRRYRKQTINLQENIYLFIFFLILIFIILYYIFICVFMYLFIYYPFNTETGCITIDYFTETVGYHKEKRYPYVWQGEPFVARVIQTRFLDNHPDSMRRRKPFGVDYTSTSIVDQNIFNTKFSFDFDADSMS